MPRKTAESESSRPSEEISSGAPYAGSGWLSPDTSIQAPGGTRFAELFHLGDVLVTVAAPGRAAPVRLEDVRFRPFKGEVLRLRLEGGSELLCAQGSMVYARISGCSTQWCAVLAHGPGNLWSIVFDRNPVSVTSLPGLLEAWILCSGQSRDDIGYRGTLASLIHGVPFFDATPRKGWPPPMADKLAADLDLPARGLECLEAAGMLKGYPHFTNYPAMGLKPLNLVMFSGEEYQVPGGGRRRTHRIHLDLDAGKPTRERANRDRTGHGVSKPDKTERDRPGTELSPFSGATGGVALRLPGESPEKWEMWNIDVTKEEYSELLLLARTFASLDTIRIVEKAVISPGRTFVKFPVENLGPAMTVPYIEGESFTERRVEAVDRVPFSGNLVRLRPSGLPLAIASGTPLWVDE